MAKFALDTNVYIDALRLDSHRQALKAFLSEHLPVTFLSAVVLQEILAGARSNKHAEILEAEIGAPFIRRGRTFAPTVAAWWKAGTLLASLQKGTRSPSSAFLNDTLLALSCREAGITLISRDSDLTFLAEHIPGLGIVPPFPN